MRVDIYRIKKRSSPRDRCYLFVPLGHNPADLPQEEMSALEVEGLEKTLDINRGEKRIALNTEEAIDSLEAKGYYIQEATVQFQIRFPDHPACPTQ